MRAPDQRAKSVLQPVATGPLVTLDLHGVLERDHAEPQHSARLGLSGRSARALKSLTTSRFYRLDGTTVVPLASFFLERDFFRRLRN